MKKIVAVFHVKQELFRAFYLKDEAKPSFPRDYVLAATVETDDSDVDYVYELTNTIRRPWYLNVEVRPTGLSLRSTSVGDILVKDDNTIVRVAPVGFEEVGLGGESLPYAEVKA